MALRLADKQALVAEVNEVAASSESAIAAEYRGLSVAQMTEFRAIVPCCTRCRCSDALNSTGHEMLSRTVGYCDQCGSLAFGYCGNLPFGQFRRRDSHSETSAVKVRRMPPSPHTDCGLHKVPGGLLGRGFRRGQTV